MKPDTREITVVGIYHVTAVLCYKCGARVYPAASLKDHLGRHDLNRKILVRDFKGNVVEKRRWEISL